jgi:hypothetical protein
MLSRYSLSVLAAVMVAGCLMVAGVEIYPDDRHMDVGLSEVGSTAHPQSINGMGVSAFPTNTRIRSAFALDAAAETDERSRPRLGRGCGGGFGPLQMAEDDLPPDIRMVLADAAHLRTRAISSPSE